MLFCHSHLMKKQKCWVWFKGGIDGDSRWHGGFTATSCEEGVLIERSDYVSCHVPEWRISTTEPDDLSSAPVIPDDAKWKLL